jgi:hypothetical protein
MSRARIHQLLAFATAVFVLSIFASSCSSPEPTAAPPSPAPPAPLLWGELKPVVSVKELMRDLIDPASDFVFDSVSTVISRRTLVETTPKTDKDWERIRFGATTMAEGIYLLKIPRPFAPPGDENNSTGPEPEELTPAQIKAKLEADPVLWNAKIEALRNVALEVLEIVKKKDAKALWDANEDLDQACENCHLEYWYPGDTALLKKLDRRLEELYGLHPESSHKIGMDPK